MSAWKRMLLCGVLLAGTACSQRSTPKGGAQCDAAHPCETGLACVVDVTGAGTCQTAQCSTNDQCGRSGKVCLAGWCYLLCEVDGDCAPTESCVDARCIPRTSGSVPPTVDTINGTGTTDTTAGHATRHLDDRLVITGSHLTGATATLVDAGGHSTALASCGTPTDTELQVELPSSVTAGTYTLSVANQAGTCDASVHLLQGEPGSLTASATDIISAVNGALAADPTVRLRGALPTGQALSVVSATASQTAADRSIVVDGIEQVNDPASPSLFLAVLDLATHTVVDHLVSTSFGSRQAFASGGDFTQHQGLRDVLSQLEAQDVLVVLASTGDITSMSSGAMPAGDTGPTLVSVLKDYGASQRFQHLAATDSYVLVGRPGIGEGNGLEQVAGASLGGVARQTTTVVDRAVAGIASKWLGVPFAIGPLRVDAGGVTAGAGPTAGANGNLELLPGGASPVSGRLTFGTDGTGWQLRIAKNQAGAITDIVTVTDAGTVGIGTSTPHNDLGFSAALEVAGDVRAARFYDDDPAYYADLNSGGNLAGTWRIHGNVQADSGRAALSKGAPCTVGWCTLCTPSAVSTTATAPCTGYMYYASSSGGCYGAGSSTCSCTFLGYLH